MSCFAGWAEEQMVMKLTMPLCVTSVFSSVPDTCSWTKLQALDVFLTEAASTKCVAARQASWQSCTRDAQFFHADWAQRLEPHVCCFWRPLLQTVCIHLPGDMQLYGTQSIRIPHFGYVAWSKQSATPFTAEAAGLLDALAVKATSYCHFAAPCNVWAGT